VNPHPSTLSSIGRSRLAATALAGVALAMVVCGCSSSSSGASPTKKPALTNAAKDLNAGIVAAKQGQNEKAKQLFNAVLVSQPHNVMAHYNLGVLAQQANDTAGALVQYGEALAANPKYVPALYNQAVIEAVSHPSVAMATYRRIVVLQHNAPTAYLNLGLLEVKHGQRQQGLPDLLQAIKEDPALASGLPKKLRNAVGAIDAAPSPSAAS
jgi:tetratricopeptide (TPR) repeat protein